MLKCLLIELVIPNLSFIYFCIPEIFKINVSNRFLSKKSSFEIVFFSFEFSKKVILNSKSWCEMFVSKLSGTQIKLYDNFLISMCLSIIF